MITFSLSGSDPLWIAPRIFSRSKLLTCQLISAMMALVIKMDQTIARMITLLARKSQVYLGNMLDQYGLSAGEQPFFMALQRHEGITQEELTALVCVDKSATARAVKSLEAKGYLVRVQDRRDRRLNRLYPTDLAKRLGPAVKQDLLHFNELLTQEIGQEELTAMYEGLLKMEENLAALSNGNGAKQGGQRDGA